jgi:hypothetical protein
MPTLATAPNEHSTAKLARPANQRQPLSLRSQYVSLLLNVKFKTNATPVAMAWERAKEIASVLWRANNTIRGRPHL